MSKDVKSLPGEGIGWGEEGEAGRELGAKLSVHRVSVTSVSLNAAKLSSGTRPQIKDELQSENVQKRLEKNFF